MAEAKTSSCCIVVCCDDKTCRVIRCDAEEAKGLLAKIEEFCEDGEECGA